MPRLNFKISPRTRSVTAVIFSSPVGANWVLRAQKNAVGINMANTLGSILGVQAVDRGNHTQQ